MRRLALTVAALSHGWVAVVWVAAKVDFFTRYDPANVSGYIAGHWPLWAVMIVLAGLGFGLAHVAGKPQRAHDADAPCAHETRSDDDARQSL